jgi:acyl carrier protein
VSAPSSGSVVSVPATARPVGFDAVPPGGPAPDLVVVRADGGGRDARAAVLGVLDVLRAWSEDERFAGSRLAVVTSGAVAAGPEGDLSDPAGAAVWGLIRAAQAEHPGRFLLVDVEDPGSADRFVSIAAGLPDEEQIAVRGSDVLVPRLARLRREDDVEPIASATFGAEAGTVLVTGATGGVGALVARHLVTGHGVRRLLLLSRRGPDAPGAGDLVDDLRERGAEVVLAACDVGDRAALAEVLVRETTDHPVTAVVHAAGIFDDATLGSMTAEQVDRVFRAKVDAARNLDELTAGLPLTAFVLFSSSAGVFGGAGQASYSSANAYLDGFAHERRLRGLPGLSLAWGLWADERGMGGQIGETQRRRHGRRGIAAMSAEDALALFDAACASAEPALLPMRLDWPSLHARARVTGVPPLLRGLVRVARRQAGNDSRELTRRLAGMSAPERVAAVTDMVRDLVAGVLGYESRDAVDPELPFRDLGFDSLTAVELRNMLNAATGLRLPVTAVFDHPHPVLLAEHLAEELSGADVPAGNGADPEEARVRGLLASVPLDRLRTAGLLEALIALGDDEPATDRPADRRAQIEAMDADELIRMAMAEEKS